MRKSVWLLALLIRIPSSVDGVVEAREISFETQQAVRMQECGKAEARIIATTQSKDDVDDICRGDVVGLETECEMITSNCGY